MATEADFKRHFKRSLAEQGNIGFSLNSITQAGLMDMFVTSWYAESCLVEAKWLGDVTARFDLKIMYTNLQLHNMNKLYAINPKSVYGLIGWESRDTGTIFAALVFGNDTRITHNFRTETAWVSIKSWRELFNTNILFEMANILHKKRLAAEEIKVD